MQKLAQGHAIAKLRGSMAGHLRRILDCLRQDRRIAPFHDGGARSIERIQDGDDSPVWIDCDLLPTQFGEMRLECIGWMEPHGGPKMSDNLVCHFFAVDEQFSVFIDLDQRIRPRDQCVRDILPVDIECPRNRIERAQDGRIGLNAGQPTGNLPADWPIWFDSVFLLGEKEP